MPADMGRKSPLRDGSNKESICAEIKQISSLLQFKTCAPALSGLPPLQLRCNPYIQFHVVHLNFCKSSAAVMFPINFPSTVLRTRNILVVFKPKAATAGHMSILGKHSHQQ